jgi:MoaA/NifB/PqqE/SkfB family radical SAM enzyme
MNKPSVNQSIDSNAIAPPENVQIQTITGCNGRCVFCPNGKTQRQIPMGRRMNEKLFRSVAEQCLELGVRCYTLYLMNEPLLDNDLPERIAYISARINKPQYTKITTHGGLLTEDMGRRLLDAGLDKLKISVQSIDSETYRRIMNLPLEKTLKNIERLLELKEKGSYSRPRLEIVTVDSIQTHAELPEIRRYWQARKIKLHIEPVENRIDHCEIRETAVGTGNLVPFAWCRRLTEQIFVLYDGRMVLCCSDWEQHSFVGDLTKERLADIWQGARYADYRRRFAAGDIEGMICSGCRKQVPIEFPEYAHRPMYGLK